MNRELFKAMALDLARGLERQAAGATAARLSFREFITSPRFCGLSDLSPAMLAIVDELAHLYGGRLSLTRSPLGGLRATLLLPANG